ncbi:hypothetical protein AB0N05_17355 [Nocardia sp. NPDC051030]
MSPNIKDEIDTLLADLDSHLTPEAQALLNTDDLYDEDGMPT